MKKIKKLVAILSIITAISVLCPVNSYAADTAALQAQALQAATLVYNQMQVNQINAVQQAYMLNAVQAMQNSQFNSMINSNANIDYKDHLSQVFLNYQQQALNAFLGYEGLK